MKGLVVENTNGNKYRVIFLERELSLLEEEGKNRYVVARGIDTMKDGRVCWDGGDWYDTCSEAKKSYFRQREE